LDWQIAAMNPPLHIPIQASKAGKVTPDLVIVGAGAFGLWLARHAIRAGRSVLVLEKRQVGAGASGGVVGALMPHMPDRWNAKKQAQFEALAGLEGAVRELEADTGHDCGYARVGRLIPVAQERLLPAVESRIAGARANWPGYRMEIVPPTELRSGWPGAASAPLGAQWDDLSARIDPRRLLGALAAYARRHGQIREGAEVVALADRSVVLGDATRISAGEVVVANGWEAYALLQPHLGTMTGGAPVGRGVKGQAMLLAMPGSDGLPLLYHDGAYCVPHAGGRVAIGSSSHDKWEGEADAFDETDIAFAEKAFRLAQALRDAPVLERWAGVRPRNMLKPHDTEPWYGPAPGLEGVSAWVGGFKTGLAWGGIAHATKAEKRGRVKR
jgi:glycine oxidase